MVSLFLGRGNNTRCDGTIFISQNNTTNLNLKQRCLYHTHRIHNGLKIGLTLRKFLIKNRNTFILGRIIIRIKHKLTSPTLTPSYVIGFQMLKELLYSFVNLSDWKNNGWHCSGLSYCLVMAHAWPLPHIAIRFRSIWSPVVFITQGTIPVPRHFTQLLLQFAMWWVVNRRDVDPHGSTIFSSLPTIYHEISYDKNCVKYCGTNITFRALASNILKKILFWHIKKLFYLF